MPSTLGSYKGKFRRPKKVKKSNYHMAGSVIKVENGGIIQSPDNVYVASCTTPGLYLRSSIMNAIVKKLFNKFGHYFSDFGNQIDPDTGTAPRYQTAWYYTQNSDINTQGVKESESIVFFGNQSYDNAITVTQNALNAIQTGGAGWQNFNILSVVLRVFDDDAGGALSDKYRTMATIDLQNAKFDLLHRSILKVQNTTPSFAGNTDSEDITHNPVCGYYYKGKKWKNYIDWNFVKKSDAAGQKSAPLPHCDRINGTLVFNSASFDPVEDSLRKPTKYAWKFGMSKSSFIKLGPGDIKYIKKVFKSTMKFNTILKKADNFVNGNGNMDIGKTDLLAFEKMLDNGSDSIQDIRLFVQHDVTLCCKITTTRTRTNGDTRIGDQDITLDLAPAP